MERCETKYNVNITNFTGPLDLLCFLISKNKMNIFDVSLSELTDKYMEYIYNMQTLNMEIATEFLVIASTLLYIKSKKLLPNSQDEAKSEQEEETEKELLKRISEYKLYKDKQELLRQMYNTNFGSYIKMPERLKCKTIYEMKMLPVELKLIYDKIILRNENAKNKEANRVEELATFDRITVKSKVKQIVELLKKKTSFVFATLFNAKTTQLDVVTSFMGILELSKSNYVHINQQVMYGDIMVERINETYQGNISIKE